MLSIDAFVAAIKPVHTLIVNKYYFDAIYLWIVKYIQQSIADACAWFENKVLVNGIVKGVSDLTKWFGGQIRLLLVGHLHTYVTLALGGVFFVLALVFYAR